MLSSQNKKDISVTEKFAYFSDMLMAYQDLCERREKGHSKHQKALTKMQTAVKEKDRIANQGQRLVCVCVCVCVCARARVCVL